MIVAINKRKENIAEYILYMWQIEDTIRSMNLDIKLIDQHIISKYKQPEDTILQIREWYIALIDSMKNEGKEKSGHLALISSVVKEMNMVHHSLLKNPAEIEYANAYEEAKKHITELAQKSGKEENYEIEVCLTGLYGLLMLRLQKKQPSKETLKALSSFSKLLALLSIKFTDYEQGRLELVLD